MINHITQLSVIKRQTKKTHILISDQEARGEVLFFLPSSKEDRCITGLRQLNRKIYVLTELCFKITSNLSTYQTCKMISSNVLQKDIYFFNCSQEEKSSME